MQTRSVGFFRSQLSGSTLFAKAEHIQVQQDQGQYTFNLFQEEVIESLKDIVREASKQKWYLDRLISLVIEDSPWLLDEVDTEFDNLTLTDQSEEFC